MSGSGHPHSSRRHRLLSEDERALWETVIKDAKPLAKKPARAKTVDPGKAPTGKTTVSPGSTKSKAPLNSSPSDEASRKSAPVAPPPKAGAKPQIMDRRTRSRIARGHHAIDARIDLHGKTQTEAHAALVRFLRRAQRDDARLVLVITGKGRSGEGERGVLRRQVPLWLASSDLHALVLGYETAHVGHGGEGALYVRIRRAKS